MVLLWGSSWVQPLFFIGYQETKFFLNVKKPLMYYCYVDDSFAVFESKDECEKFVSLLNFLHSLLYFMFKKELNSSLPFLDILVEKHSTEFITSVYRKPIFTSQYLHWDSFSPTKHKINLVATLVQRAMFICLSSRLQAKLNKIRSNLVANGYLNYIITSIFTNKIRKFNQSSQHGSKKWPNDLHLQWLENVSTKFEKQITTAIQCCYFAVQTLVVFMTRLLPATKDLLLSHHHNNVIHQFLCHCSSQYIG